MLCFHEARLAQSNGISNSLRHLSRRGRHPPATLRDLLSSSLPFLLKAPIEDTQPFLPLSNTLSYMCEFCNNPVGANNNKDSNHPAFAGFFSADAIQAAVAQAAKNASRREQTNDSAEDSDDDTDGT
jgi:hypothetical protein